jgi:hypothetical protein
MPRLPRHSHCLLLAILREHCVLPPAISSVQDVLVTDVCSFLAVEADWRSGLAAFEPPVKELWDPRRHITLWGFHGLFVTGIALHSVRNDVGNAV